MWRLIIASLLLFTVSAVDVKCSNQIYDPTKQRWYEFDLSALHHDEYTYIDTLWYRTNNNTIYYVNFCGQTASACDSPDTSVCVRVPDGSSFKYVSGGSTSTQEISIAEDPSQTPATSVTVTYSNGEKCGNGYFKTKMYVNCMETAQPGFFYDANEDDPCETILYMWSKAGCGREIPGPVSSSSSASDQCGGTVLDEKNKRAYHFDLSRLHHDETVYVDTLWYRTPDNIMYFMNFCGQTATACNTSDTSVCIRIPSAYDYVYLNGGSTSTQQITLAEAPGMSPDQSVTVTYSNGAKCENGNYTTRVYVNCQETADPGYFYDLKQINDCEVTLYMWSKAGCGTEVPYPG